MDVHSVIKLVLWRGGKRYFVEYGHAIATPATRGFGLVGSFGALWVQRCCATGLLCKPASKHKMLVLKIHLFQNVGGHANG